MANLVARSPPLLRYNAAYLLTADPRARVREVCTRLRAQPLAAVTNTVYVVFMAWLVAAEYCEDMHGGEHQRCERRGWGALNIEFTMMAGLNVAAAFMYLVMMLHDGYGPTQLMLLPEYANALSAGLWLAGASLHAQARPVLPAPGTPAYADEVTKAEDALKVVAIVEIVAAVIDCGTTVGWWITWWMTHERGLGRGLTMDDPECTGHMVSTIASGLYLAHYGSVSEQRAPTSAQLAAILAFRVQRFNDVLSPPRTLLRYGNICYLVAALLYLSAALREAGAWWCFPTAGSWTPHTLDSVHESRSVSMDSGLQVRVLLTGEQVARCTACMPRSCAQVAHARSGAGGHIPRGTASHNPLHNILVLNPMAGVAPGLIRRPHARERRASTMARVLGAHGSDPQAASQRQSEIATPHAAADAVLPLANSDEHGRGMHQVAAGSPDVSCVRLLSASSNERSPSVSISIDDRADTEVRCGGASVPVPAALPPPPLPPPPRPSPKLAIHTPSATVAASEAPTQPLDDAVQPLQQAAQQISPSAATSESRPDKSRTLPAGTPSPPAIPKLLTVAAASPSPRHLPPVSTSLKSLSTGARAPPSDARQGSAFELVPPPGRSAPPAPPPAPAMREHLPTAAARDDAAVASAHEPEQHQSVSPRPRTNVVAVGQNTPPPGSAPRRGPPADVPRSHLPLAAGLPPPLALPRVGSPAATGPQQARPASRGGPASSPFSVLRA